ncbi:hypothetical protein FSP39_000172 [Pinctada imbricata]|uniref:Uncharacterized protein n=1 Tax=Pinctada imbricata TaxID=66713 RepID=A0AA88Y270_PINIB|nr:hypothetical protein FSP39_000172 [Pinctada imbricata]
MNENELSIIVCVPDILPPVSDLQYNWLSFSSFSRREDPSFTPDRRSVIFGFRIKNNRYMITQVQYNAGIEEHLSKFHIPVNSQTAETILEQSAVMPLKQTTVRQRVKSTVRDRDVADNIKMSKGGRQKGGHTPKISEHKDNDDDTNKNPAGGQQADDTPGGSQQSVHDPGKKEIEVLKRRMAGQEDKVRKMAEDLEGLENEIANHKEAVETERKQREKLEETKLEEEGEMREDVTNQIVGLKKQTKDDFGKMEERLKDFEEHAKKIEDLLRLQHRIEKLEEKMKNTYIGGFFILVLAIMLGVVFTMYCGQSDPPGPSPPRPIPIPDYEMKIQALESRFNVLESNVDTKISDFQQNEMASMSSELSSLKEEYGTLKELTDGNEEFKKNHNKALDGLKTQLSDSLKQTETKLKENQEVFEQNLQKKMEDEVKGKSENLTSHIVTVVLEQEEFVILKGNVNALNETYVEERNEFINKQEKLDKRLTETKVTLSASIDSAREECMEEIQKTGQSLTNSVAKFEVEIGSVGNLVKSVNETVFERMGSVNGEVENLNEKMTEKFTSFNTQMESFQQTLKTSSEETEGKLENVQKEFDHWKKKVVTSEGKINFLDEKGQDTNFMIILVVIIIMFIVVLVVMLMLRLKSTAAPGPTNISPGLRGGYVC